MALTYVVENASLSKVRLMTENLDILGLLFCSVHCFSGTGCAASGMRMVNNVFGREEGCGRGLF
jgi:hypothetical protein